MLDRGARRGRLRERGAAQVAEQQERDQPAEHHAEIKATVASALERIKAAESAELARAKAAEEAVAQEVGAELEAAP